MDRQDGAAGVVGDGRVAAVGLRRRKPAKDGGKEEDGTRPSPLPSSTSPGASIDSKMGSFTAVPEKKGERSSSPNDLQYSWPPTAAAVVCGVGPDGEGDERKARRRRHVLLYVAVGVALVSISVAVVVRTGALDKLLLQSGGLVPQEDAQLLLSTEKAVLPAKPRGGDWNGIRLLEPVVAVEGKREGGGRASPNPVGCRSDVVVEGTPASSSLTTPEFRPVISRLDDGALWGLDTCPPVPSMLPLPPSQSSHGIVKVVVPVLPSCEGGDGGSVVVRTHPMEGGGRKGMRGGPPQWVKDIVRSSQGIVRLSQGIVKVIRSHETVKLVQWAQVGLMYELVVDRKERNV